MRLRLALLVSLLAACGGSSGTTVTDGERVPATPFPTEQEVSESGPTGFVTLLSLDGHVIAMARFIETAQRGAHGRDVSCSLSRGSGTSAPDVSAGTLTITLPTRTGEESFGVRFDPVVGTYYPTSYEAAIEPGGILHVSATGEVAPAFETEIKTAANVVFDAPDVLEIDATAPVDVPLHWMAEGDNDEVFADLRIGDASVTCWFASSARSASIPKGLITELVGDSSVDCTRSSECMLILASKRMRRVTVGDDWTVVLAHGYATTREVRVAR